MSFHSGQEVTCINANPGFATGEPVNLILNKNYIVDGYTTRGFLRVIGHDVTYSDKRFSPIRKTDISIFTEMLVKTPIKELSSV